MKLTKKSWALFPRTEERDVILIKRGKGDKQKWFFPGGEVGSEETPENAAIRFSKSQLGCEAEVADLFYKITPSADGSTEEYFFLMQHLQGELGAGDDPEISRENSNSSIVIFPIDGLMALPLEPTEVRDQLCSSFKCKFQLAFHKQVCDELASVALRELDTHHRRSDAQFTAALKERSDLNLLSFAIVGTTLTFNTGAINSPVAVFGMGTLLLNAILSYYNIREKRVTISENSNNIRNAMYKKFQETLNAYNDFAMNPNAFTEQYWQKKKIDFSLWDIEGDVPPRKERIYKMESRYMIWFAVGTAMIGIGLLLSEVNWGTVLPSLHSFATE